MGKEAQDKIDAEKKRKAEAQRKREEKARDDKKLQIDNKIITKNDEIGTLHNELQNIRLKTCTNSDHFEKGAPAYAYKCGYCCAQAIWHCWPNRCGGQDFCDPCH